jgi:hypothetical protein
VPRATAHRRPRMSMRSSSHDPPLYTPYEDSEAASKLHEEPSGIRWILILAMERVRHIQHKLEVWPISYFHYSFDDYAAFAKTSCCHPSHCQAHWVNAACIWAQASRGNNRRSARKNLRMIIFQVFVNCN